MLAPYEKFVAGGNDTIQIVVTTSCDLYTCSNCTQLLPFRTDYRHMALKVFEKAVKSLVNWPGIVGIFGGNPCCHPDFETLCMILADHIPQNRRGLWSNNLLGHGPLVRRIFYPNGRFNLNVHRDTHAAREMSEWVPGRVIATSLTNAAHHAPILLNWQDVGMTQEVWEGLRESCDINRHWSAAVVQRDGIPYAYFCEVAAALDGIKGANWGIPLYSHWWEAPMKQFERQVKGCCDAGCGVPMRGVGHLDADHTYDISPSFIPLTNLPRSPKVLISVHTEVPGESCQEATDYMRHRTPKP